MKPLQKTLLLFAFIILTSCTLEKRSQNYFEPLEMLKNEYGLLIEYALSDTSKFEFAKEIMCDSLEKITNIYFIKIETIKESDTAFLFAGLQIDDLDICFKLNDYISIELDKPDEIIWEDKLYKFSELFTLYNLHTNFLKQDLINLFEYRRIGQYYNPKIGFVIHTEKYDCKNQFLEKLYVIHKEIESEFDKISLNIYNQKGRIKPTIIITQIPISREKN